jgi:hypothetical protein
MNLRKPTMLTWSAGSVITGDGNLQGSLITMSLLVAEQISSKWTRLCIVVIPQTLSKKLMHTILLLLDQGFIGKK